MFNRLDKSNCNRIRTLAMVLVLLWGWAGLETAAFGSVLDFDATTDASNVANTGLSEVLGDVILTAKSSCGTSFTDNLCVNEADSIQVRYTNIEIDNSAATGIQVCESVSGNYSCNVEGNFMTGEITVSADTVTIGLKPGANLSEMDRLTIAGVRARIATGLMITPGVESDAVVSATPESAAKFPSDTLVVARSAIPLSLQVTAVPEIPCQAGDPQPAVLVTEGYPAAFVDYGDPLERSFPGQPLLPRNPLGGNANTRISLTVSGLSADVQINWPVTVSAQNSSAVLDLISQSADGTTATYVFGTSDQLQSDDLIEIFAVRLDYDNFRFSGSDPLDGLASVQAQILPPPEPENIRPRFDDPLRPEPGLLYFQVRRCTPLVSALGSAEIHAMVDGLEWSGSLYFHLEGPVLFNGTHAPETVSELPVGPYLAQRLSGGPAGATLSDIAPAATQSVTSGTTTIYTFNFTGPTIASLQLNSMPLPVCASASTQVGTFQLVNGTNDTQIIPSGTTLTVTFSNIIDTPPTVTGLGDFSTFAAASSIDYHLNEAVLLPPGGVVEFSGARLNLNGLSDGQQATVLVSSAPANAISLGSNQATLATAEASQCLPPPPTFSELGVTNGASFAPGLSAGSIATIFGNNLSTVTGIVQASSIPLPLEMEGTSVTVNGIAAPLFALANVNGQEQINFQVPWEVAGGGSVTLIVNNNGLLSDPVEVSLLPAFPGIFTTDGISGAILHGIGSALVTPSNPATPGEVVTIYGTGLGAVSSAPATGNVALDDPLSYTSLNPTVTVGGLAGTVKFSGLAPGYVGLYQVNVELPQNVPSGTQNIVLEIGGQSSEVATIPIQ